MDDQEALVGLADRLEGVLQARDEALAAGGGEDLAEARERFSLELAQLEVRWVREAERQDLTRRTYFGYGFVGDVRDLALFVISVSSGAG